MTERTLWTRFRSAWCDDCGVAYRRADVAEGSLTQCPGCQRPMRRAVIQVEPLDVDAAEWPSVLGGRWAR